MKIDRCAGIALWLVAVAPFALSTPGRTAALAPPDEARAEQVESQCKINAEEFGLKGKAFDASVENCVSQESPDLGFWEDCRTHGRHRHLRGGALRNFVTYCMSRAP